MATHPIVPTADVARKFLALIDQRRAHLSELYDTGRWKHYYTAEELLEALREAVTMRDAWAKIAGLQPDEASQADDEGDEALFRQAG